MPKPEMKDTAVTNWLETNLAEPEIVKAFYDADLFEVTEVHDADIDALVSKDKRGLVNRLKGSLKEQNKPKPEPEPKEKLKPTPPPNLPAGQTFDLSAPSLTYKDVEFKIPASLPVSVDGKPTMPADLKNEDWMVVANFSKFIYGFDMSRPLPTRPREPVLYWKVPSKDRAFMRNEADRASVWSTVTYSSETSSYVRCGFDREKASASYLFCAASVERSHKEREARISNKTRRYMVGCYRYPRATVFLDACTTVSPKFQAAVEAALEANDPASELAKVLARFGHAVPQEVLLGGQLMLSHSEESARSVREEESEDKISAAVSVKVGNASGDVEVSKETSTKTREEAENIAQKTNFEGLGGDTRLTSDPPKWVNTVGDAHWWAVIENQGIISTLELLPDELKARASKYWREPLPPPMSNWATATNYPAETDGFLSTWIALAGDGDSAEILAYTDSSPYPQERRSIASIDWRGENRMRNAGVFMPARAGDHVRVEVIARVGTPSITILFQPFPLALGEWSPLKFNTHYPKRNEDGFVVASMWGGDGDRGWIVGRQGQELANCAAASMHQYSDFLNGAESFCMPVVRESDFQIDFTATNGAPTGEVYWIPMGASHRMQSLSHPVVNDINRAETDGILTGYTYTDVIGAAPSGEIVQHDERSSCSVAVDSPR